MTIAVLDQRTNEVKKITQLLRLVAHLRNISDVSTAEGLREAVRLLLELAVLLNANENFLQRLKTVFEDENTFQIVLSIIRYLAGSLTILGEPSDGKIHLSSSDTAIAAEISMQALLEWLPFVFDILELLRGIFDSFE